MAYPELYSTAKSLGFTITEVPVGQELRIAGGGIHFFNGPPFLVRQGIEHFRFLRKAYRPRGRPPLTRRREFPDLHPDLPIVHFVVGNETD